MFSVQALWCVFAVVVGAALSRAQIPSHAVLLNPTASLNEIKIARSGDGLHVVGITPSPYPFFIHYAGSTDGGRTWPMREVPLAYAYALGDLVAEGPHVHVAVSTRWAGPFVISSNDGGTTWAPGVRVSQESNVLAVSAPILRKNGPVLNVVWVENRGDNNIYTNRSVDHGVTWMAHDQNLSAGLPSGTDFGPTVVALGGELHVFWGRVSPTVQTLYQRSLDGGATWLPAPQVLALAPVVLAVGDLHNLVVSNASGAMLRSDDSGLSWTPVTGHGITQVVDLAICGAHVLLVGRQGNAFPIDVQLQVSDDAGATWLSVPYIVPQWRNATITARATADASFVHFAFANDSSPLPGCVIQSDDSGGSWRLVAGDAGAGISTSVDGALVLAKPVNRPDVWAWVLEGHTTFGRGSPGTGGLEPSLAGGDLAGLSRTFRLTVGNARGGSLGGLFTSFTPLADVPFGAARLYVVDPIVTTPFLTNGVQGAPAGGSADVYVAVPADPALAGFPLRSQAFVIDPAVADGYAATAAVESWIR